MEKDKTKLRAAAKRLSEKLNCPVGSGWAGDKGVLRAQCQPGPHVPDTWEGYEVKAIGEVKALL